MGQFLCLRTLNRASRKRVIPVIGIPRQGLIEAAAGAEGSKARQRVSKSLPAFQAGKEAGVEGRASKDTDKASCAGAERVSWCRDCLESCAQVDHGLVLRGKVGNHCPTSRSSSPFSATWGRSCP